MLSFRGCMRLYEAICRCLFQRLSSYNFLLTNIVAMKKLIKRILFGLLLILAILLAVVLIRTAGMGSKQIQVSAVNSVEVDENRLVEHLSQAIQIQTISYQDPSQFRAEEFLKLHDFLEKTFPKTHSALKKEVVNNYSLLYTWKGKNESLKPILLMAHMDVVPVEPGTEGSWSYKPFEGRVADGYIWGRGALDVKSAVLALLEAVEAQLEKGFEPQRTIYLAFGHDEEVSRHGGAAQIASLL